MSKSIQDRFDDFVDAFKDALPPDITVLAFKRKQFGGEIHIGGGGRILLHYKPKLNAAVSSIMISRGIPSAASGVLWSLAQSHPLTLRLRPRILNHLVVPWGREKPTVMVITFSEIMAMPRSGGLRRRPCNQPRIPNPRRQPRGQCMTRPTDRLANYFRRCRLQASFNFASLTGAVVVYPRLVAEGHAGGSIALR